MNTDQLPEKLNLDASIRQRMALTRAALALDMTAESLRTVSRKMDEVAQALKEALGSVRFAVAEENAKNYIDSM